MLAGGHSTAVNFPLPERFVLHKVYSSTKRHADPAKPRKDGLQAAASGAVIVETDMGFLHKAAQDAPPEVLDTARSRLPALSELFQARRHHTTHQYSPPATHSPQ